MSTATTVYKPSDCYTWVQMARRYCVNLDLATPAGRHRASRSLVFARQNKGLPHIKFGTRTIMYPREQVDTWLRARQRNCTPTSV